MGPARRIAPLLRAGAMICLAGWALQAAAQDKPRPRPKPLPEASDTTATPGNSLGAPDPALGSPASPLRAAKPPPLAPAPAPPLVLRSAVHSRYSRTPTIARSTTGQCRAQCSVARTQCAGGEGDTSGCDPGWTQCLSTCDGLGYSRVP